MLLPAAIHWRASDVQPTTGYHCRTINPASQLRLSLGNLAARDYVSSNTLDSVNPAGQALRVSSSTTAPSWPNLQLRLELKL